MSGRVELKTLDLSRASKFLRLSTFARSYDIYHMSGLSWPEPRIMAFLARERLIYTGHGLALFETGLGFHYTKRLLAAERVLLQKAVLVVAVSDKLASLMNETVKGLKGRLVVIPPCVEPMQPQPSPFDFPYILFVGKPVGAKGLDVALRVWEKVRSQMPEHRLVVVGYPKESQHHRVVWRASVPHHQMAGLISGASCLLNASRYESFGMPPVEAAGLGVVPVVSRGAGVAQLLARSFPELVFDPEDPDQGAMAVLMALKEPPRPRELKKWARRFSPQRVAEDYAQIYFRVAES